MKPNVSFLAGAAIGYVLGARAGRQRYEQIKTGASKLWSSDPVQARVGDATDAVKTQAAPFVVDKLGDVAKSVAQTLKKQAGKEDLPASIHRGSDGRLHADTSGYGPGEGKLP